MQHKIKFNVPGTVILIVWWDGVHVCVGEIIKGTTIVQINNQNT